MASEWQENSIELTSASKPGAVTYFIQASHGGPIKIGRSTKDGLKSRLASIQTGHPYPLVVTRVMDGDYEADVHEQFAEHRLSGEWFSPARSVAQFSGAKAEGDTDDHARANFAGGYEAGYTAGLNAARHELKQIGDELELLRRQTQFDSLSSTVRPKDAHAAFLRFIREQVKGA